MSLTTKELMLIQDNMSMTQNSIKFMQGCAELAQEPQIKTLCQRMVSEHQADLQTLSKHINTGTIQ